MTRLLLAFGLSAALVGCTQKAPPAAQSPSTQADVAAPPAADAAPAQQASAAAEAAAPVNTGPPTGQPIPSRWKAGVNYTAVLPAQPTSVDAGQVEVLEFLWLGCPHCYELNPHVEAWKKKLPPYVKFSQVHVTWDAGKQAHAKLFYTITALGGDPLVVKAFDEIHRKGNLMLANNDSATQQMQLEFAVANGVDAAAFRREYNGFAVNGSVQRAGQLMRTYRINGVPAFIVNGKYRADVSSAGGSDLLMQLLTDLAASEKTR
jgi:protein dithiol oxidoreductase (disulfide-forming)